MPLSPFHAMLTTCELSALRLNKDRLLPAYASVNIDIYPYQVAAALFALRSPYLKGAVLADEGSLGKTYESLLVISQLYFEGRDKILLIVTTPLLQQWVDIMDGHFSIPFTVADRSVETAENPFDSDLVVLTTYDYAAENAELIRLMEWNIVVFEEAHKLSKYYTGENKTATVLKDAVGDAFKLLLTATPMQNSIMDLYGLIKFIDGDALGDADVFQKRYFRKPENYGELTAVASRYCYRTLRTQVDRYVKIPRRLPVTVDYTPTAPEKRLTEMLNSYINKQNKLAFPQMDTYELNLMLSRTLSSSTFAFDRLLRGGIKRVEEKELVEMQKLTADITVNAKGQELLKALKRGFGELKKRGANRKVLIFTENRTTQGYLAKLLTSAGYNTLTYSGDKSRDCDIIKDFEAKADILVATDIASEGFNLAFCSFVVNYDMPYNILTLEQRIMRCHRQGQHNDVIVLNFLNRGNFADVRMMELINKRVLQFDGIFGMSDDIVGNFAENIDNGLTAAFETARNKKDIEADFQQTLNEYENPNTTAVREAENVLFTTFTREVADKVTVTPQYIKDKTIEFNGKLWALTEWFFDEKQGYIVNSETRTLHVGINPQKVFTGAALRRREYSINDKTHTLTGSLAKNIIAEIFWRGVPENGSIVINNLVETTKICYYKLTVKSKSMMFGGLKYYAFAGQTASGRALSDAECREIMSLPVVSFIATDAAVGERDGFRKSAPDDIDKLIDPQTFIRRALEDTDEARRDEIAAITERSRLAKSALNREVESLKNELRQIENALGRTATAAERVVAEKRRATASKGLKQREQSLFMDGIKIDAEAEEAVTRLTDEAGMTVEVTRLFMINVSGVRDDG